jgi:inward rectifier potassium channel
LTDRPATPRSRLVIASLAGGQPVRAIGASSAPASDLYYRLLTWSWTRLFLVMGALYLSVNALFALGYLALGPGAILHARPGSFEDAFFFAFQTMATIGYGDMLPRGTASNVLSVVQVMIGLAGMAVTTGLVFAKFARPTARVLFSRVAVVHPFDGTPCLQFRMANERANQIVEARLSVALLRQERTAEGEEIRRARDLILQRDRSLAFQLTWTAVHPIVPGSPLYGLDAAALAAGDATLVASLMGTDEHLGQSVHARHSWRAEEILFDVRFADILTVEPDGARLIDYRRFHEVVPFEGGPPTTTA